MYDMGNSNSASDKWETGIKNKDHIALNEALYSGYLPKTIGEKVSITYQNENIECGIMELLLMPRPWDGPVSYFNIPLLDDMLARGEPLPEAKIKREDFTTTREYFEALMDSFPELYIALHRNKKLINEQDEEGDTLLHHGVYVSEYQDRHLKMITSLLFNTKGLDLTKQNKFGYTSIHTAAVHTTDRYVFKYVFPDYLECAVKCGFDFTILDKLGDAVLHIAAKVTLTEYGFVIFNNVENLLKHAPDIDVNILSAKGATAFYFAIEYLKLSAAVTLLDKGADPLLYGSKKYDPLEIIELRLTELREKLNDEPDNEGFSSNLNSLEAIKKIVLAKKEKRITDRNTDNKLSTQSTTCNEAEETVPGVWEKKPATKVNFGRTQPLDDNQEDNVEASTPSAKLSG